MADRLVPKLVVASQTKVIEVAVDAAGEMVPCTPVVTVEPFVGAPSLAHLAAALTSPLASLLLLQEAAGSALSAHAMRVSARALGALPLPPEGPDWDAAAAAVEALDGPPTERRSWSRSAGSHWPPTAWPDETTSPIGGNRDFRDR